MSSLRSFAVFARNSRFAAWQWLPRLAIMSFPIARPSPPHQTTQVKDAAGSPSIRAGRRRLLVHAAFGAAGVLALALLVRGVGVAALVATVRALGRWIPLLFALEGCRIAAEAVMTWSVSRHVRRSVGLGAMTRIHVVGFAVASVMPAGRAACEAVKAAMLSRYIGAPRAAAVGAANQSLAMLGGGLMGVACAVAAVAITGLSPLALAFAAYVLVTAAACALVQIACRRPSVGGFLLRRFARADQAASSFRDALAEIPVVPACATVVAFVNRVIQALELGILVHAVGGRAGVGGALLATGVNLVGGSIGDLVPGQLGATDGAFALAAPALGVALADGVAIALTIHLVQLAWAAVGAVAAIAWRPASAQVEDAGGELPAPRA
jgi:hypothetical protein